MKSGKRIIGCAILASLFCQQSHGEVTEPEQVADSHPECSYMDIIDHNPVETFDISERTVDSNIRVCSNPNSGALHIFIPKKASAPLLVDVAGVVSIAFSPDDRQIVIGGDGNDILFPTNTEIAEASTKVPPNALISVSPTTKILVLSTGVMVTAHILAKLYFSQQFYWAGAVNGLIQNLPINVEQFHEGLITIDISW